MAEFHYLPTSSARDEPPQEWRQWNRIAELRAKRCERAPVPDLSHTSYSTWNDVYEPSDDTFLLLDALWDDLPPDKPTVALEIGCGSGVATVGLAQYWKQRGYENQLDSIVTDINPKALEVAQATYRQNLNSHLPVVQASLSGPIRPECLDVIIFNPPYVVTDDSEVGQPDISAAWAGGKHGRVVIDEFLRMLPHLRCTIYLVVVDDNRPWEFMEIPDWEVRPLLRRRARNEYLSILKFKPKSPLK